MAKIKSIETHLVRFKLSTPSAVAYACLEEVENILVRIQTSDGLCGWGNCSPDPEVTGEDITSAKALFEKIPDLIQNRFDSFEIPLINKELAPYISKNPAAVASVDIALYDILGKKLRQPLYKIFGQCRGSVEIAYTIGLIELADALENVRSALKKGFRILKIKTGKSAGEDIERIRKVFEISGENCRLRIDANQAYSIKDSLKVAEAVKDLPVDFIEQPTNKKDYASLKKVKNKSPLKIMVDEGAVTMDNMRCVCENDAADFVNIKLMKCGGIFEAIKQNAVAEAFGKKAMIGSMDESAVSIAAGFHLAMSQPNIIFADLDGHLDILDDVATGGFRFKNGKLSPIAKFGLGVDVEI